MPDRARPGRSPQMKNFILFDVGTTNIQGLFLKDGTPKAYAAVPNSQAAFGEDVISRMAQYLKGEQRVDSLRSAVVGDMVALIKTLKEKTYFSDNEVFSCLICANPVMQHIMLGLPLEQLARAPFRPSSSREFVRGVPGAMGLGQLSGIPEIVFLPNIGGFVGSDALCVIELSGMVRSRSFILCLDLGTNGEIALGREGNISAASTSAGPAFNNWKMKCNLPGNILIDAISWFLEEHIIDATGFMPSGEAEYSFAGVPVKITQKDVREFQLAKAAIAAAIKMLRQAMNARQIEKVFLTGLFGSMVDPVNAKRAGLLPEDIASSSVAVMDKGALMGLAELARDYSNIERRVRIALSMSKHLELHTQKDFLESFSSAIGF